MIDLGGGFRISSDGNGSYQVEEVVIAKSGKLKGEERVVVRGYYGSLEGAINGYVKKTISGIVRDKNATIDELLQEVRNVREDISNKIGGI